MLMNPTSRCVPRRHGEVHLLRAADRADPDRLPHREPDHRGHRGFKTACQQVCPTNALTFGSLHDPKTQVSQRHADPRRFDVLHELNTRPRTVYLTKIKNPNPELG